MENIPELGARVVRQVYLITYSQANIELVPTRQRFADLVLEAFNFGRVQPLHWAVCQEPHIHGGFHYHMALCLSSNMRWGPAKRALANQGINVHFQDNPTVDNYVGAYIYVCKSDRDVVLSPGHPNLSPAVQFRTAAASRARRRGRANNDNEGPPAKAAKLTHLHVMQIIRANNIKNETALLALAQSNYDVGLVELMEYVANTSENKYNKLIT